MVHHQEKERYLRNTMLVRQLLNEAWDPIGGCPADEYDSYAVKLYSMLMNENASVETIADYLYYIESEHMGLGHRLSRKDVCVRVADKLIEMKPKLDVANDDG